MSTQIAKRVGNFRGGASRNEYFVYGDNVVSGASKTIDVVIDGRYYFLLRKIHLVNFVSPTSTTGPLDYQLRILDKARERYFQNIAIANSTVGGHVRSPNVLPAPMLFGPADIIQLQIDRNTRVRYALEGEHLTNPDPAWVKRMQSRYWYQAAILGVPVTGKINLDIRDAACDFAVCRVLSLATANGYLSNANPGLQGIRELGPQGTTWQNTMVPNLNFGGIFANGSGPRSFYPPRILPLSTTLEIQTDAIPVNAGYQDLVLDGIKYPKGTRFEEWL